MASQVSLDSGDLKGCIETLISAYQRYLDEFKRMTRKARPLFARRQWQELQAITVDRLNLYRRIVDETESVLRTHCGPGITEPALWRAAKRLYIQRIAELRDRELAETFFNSVTRRIFKTVGVNANIEFVNSEFDVRPQAQSPPIFRRYKIGSELPLLISQILDEFEMGCGFADQMRDARRAAQKLEQFIMQLGWSCDVCHLEIVEHPFYRDHGAYLVGRLQNGEDQHPVAFALHNGPHGIYLDAVLFNQDQIRVLFSFARSYFFVEADHPHELVHFLKHLMPAKKKAELYISLGFNKHGKTELYRHLMDYLTTCGFDRFQFAEGKRGMVMIAFNMPNDDMMFKLIRDRFERPKKTSRNEVMQRYDYVFRHERAGRLLDVQTFEHLKLETCCFEEDLMDELLTEASQSVRSENNHLIFDHIYVERRVTPLDIYLQKADRTSAKAAVLDFGQAIKDLARVNIFPGDMLIKNFGVSRLGRVVFYDYDELCPLTICNFRKIPPPRNEMDEMASEPWYFVDEHDVFPEEFKFFLGFPDDLRQIFMAVHGDLFEADFWRETKDRILAGELIHITPYAPATRMKN